jgi:uncharacterized protein YijF (DUF1287 family)
VDIELSKRAGFLFLLAIMIVAGGATACQQVARMAPAITGDERRKTVAIDSPTVRRAVEDAVDQANYTLYYDPAYVKLDYPGGDVPRERGACSDVIIRAFRKSGVDLQKEIHEDMTRSFSAYPQKWGLARPDPNIDHRRVPNLMTYFTRQRKAVAISSDAGDYLPGDVVAWDLGGGTTHIGLVTNIMSDNTNGFLLAHNIGAGVRVEDVLFAWRIIGHYRFF